jgi:DNA-binding beta-propeller fold protein YncE
MPRPAPVALALGLLLGCADTNALPPDPVELLVVANSQANSVAIVPVDPAEPTVTVPLSTPRGRPMSLAAFDRYALVPLGDLDQVAVVDLQQGTLVQRIPLPPGSRPTGAIMLDASIGYVANSGRNTISLINVPSEHVREIAVGVSPQGFAFARGRLFVLNANLDSTGEPVGASWLTVINPATNALAPGIDSVPLTGPGYAASAAVGGDGLIYIVNRGRSTTPEGRLSVVDPLERKEVASFAGLGLQPGQIATDGGVRVFVSSQTEGLLEFNTDSNAVIRGEGEGVPIPTNAGVAVDSEGLVYAIQAGDCDPGRPGFAHVLDDQLVQIRMVQLGRCSAGAQVARIVVEAVDGP